MTNVQALQPMPPSAASHGVVGRRCTAWLIDVLILALIMLPLWVAMMLLGVVTLGLGFAALSLLPAVPFLYTLFWTAAPRSATPGQRMMGIEVRRHDDLGHPTGLQALIWTVGYTITICAGMIWMAVALITSRNRTLHDLAAGLLVVPAEEATDA